MLKKYLELREKYPRFCFDSYEYTINGDTVSAKYNFSIDGLARFSPQWTFVKKCETAENDSVLEKLIFSLGLVELISYWKITCSPQVKINCGFLEQEQINWWKKQYFYGLGEFFHTNDIQPDFDSFMQIEVNETRKIEEKPKTHCNLAGCLVPVGGGKDSAVTLEILKNIENINYNDDVACYVINPRGATDETARAAGIKDENVIIAKRTLDKNMLDLNRQGFLNGHTPFSAIVAFSSVITAYLCGKKYVVLSNEASANESTVADSKINHQYSKSFDFEKDFHDYEKEYIGSGVYYFSLLRPLSEFQIAKYFAQHKQYHGVFKSCNAGSKQNVWCANCPKCLFVSIILSPFLSSDELTAIFGENLFEKASLEETFDKLAGILPEKPFECVGSRDEVNESLNITVKNLKLQGKEPAYLLKRFKDGGYAKEPTGEYDRYYNSENLLPEKFQKALKKSVML